MDINQLKTVFKSIDENQEQFILNLKEAVAIKSVSALPEARQDTIDMMKWFKSKLESQGAVCELVDIGRQKHPSGVELPLPPVLFGYLGANPSKKTLCIYGHLDVQPAVKEDGWYTEPFELVEKFSESGCPGKKLYGRGATDDKGPVMAWLHAIETYNKLNIEIPCNLKFVMEGMEESGSEGLDDLVRSRKDTFFADVDFTCISDSYWLGTKKPCLSYGLRGNAKFIMEVECAGHDLHSGVYGGSVYEAMSDLIAMLNTLVDVNGKILVPGVLEDVAELTDDERRLYDNAHFDLDEYKCDVGCGELLHKTDKSATLMARWRYPTLSIHGIEGAYSASGFKMVIPRKVIGKFSLRLVPNQQASKIKTQVINYLNDQWKARRSPNKFKVELLSTGNHWLANTDGPNFVAGRKAVKHVYGVEPDLIREGGSIPITITFQEVTGKEVLLIPIGASDDGAHSQNEKIDRRNYIEGTKLLAAYIYEIGKA